MSTLRWLFNPSRGSSTGLIHAYRTYCWWRDEHGRLASVWKMLRMEAWSWKHERKYVRKASP